MSQIAAKLSFRPAIDRLLRPSSIAIVGASTTPRALGNTLLNVLQDAGYPGKIYLVNPNYTEIQGRKCVPVVDDLPSGLDCATLAIPRAAVLETVQVPKERSLSLGRRKSHFADSSPGHVNSGSALASGMLDGVKAQPGDAVFFDQSIALLVKLADIPPIEPGTMETERKMTTAVAWHVAATAALPVPVPADR